MKHGRLLLAGLVLLAGCPPRHDYGDGRGLAGQLEREVIALQQKNRILEHRAATCSEGGPPDRLYSELVQVFKDSELDLNRSANVTSLSIPGSHLFATGRMEIRLEATKTLDLLGMALAAHPKHSIVIESHVSDRTLNAELRREYRDDWALSFAFADLVKRDLVNKYHVGEQRFTVSSRAQFDPISSNDTPAGQARNERIVLYIRPPVGE